MIFGPSDRPGCANGSALSAVVAALIGGFIGYASTLPGGPLVGALIATALVGRRWATRVPSGLTVAAQLAIGAAAGALVTRAVVVELWAPLLIGVGISVIVLGVAVVSGYVLARTTGLDFMSAALCFVPGGLSEIAVFADDYGVRTEVVVAVHLVRRVITITLVVLIAAWGLR